MGVVFFVLAAFAACGIAAFIAFVAVLAVQVLIYVGMVFADAWREVRRGETTATPTPWPWRWP